MLYQTDPLGSSCTGVCFRKAVVNLNRDYLEAVSVLEHFKGVTENWIRKENQLEDENLTSLNRDLENQILSLSPSRCSTALCFTCAWYSSIVTGGLLHLLLVQAINISYNVTEREARLALRDKSARSAYCGLVVDTGVYSRGFAANWAEFMQMGDKMSHPSATATNMV